MKINTLIVDDDPNWRTIVAKFVGMNPLLNLVGVCESALEGYGQIAEGNVDLLICDIEMPEMSGLSLVRSIQNPPLTIFITSHSNYALDCYEVSPIDFLLKPLDLERFLKSIEKARKHFENKIDKGHIEPYFFIREDLSYTQIAYNEVLFIKAQENFVQIVAKNKTYMPILSISKLEEILRGDVFLRVHRSYIVHRAAISKITKNHVVLNTGQEIPIGDQYRNKISNKHIEGNFVSRGS